MHPLGLESKRPGSDIGGRTSLSGRLLRARAGVTFSAPLVVVYLLGEGTDGFWKVGIGGVLLSSGRKVVVLLAVELVFIVLVLRSRSGRFSRWRSGVEGSMAKLEVVDLLFQRLMLPEWREAMSMILVLVENISDCGVVSVKGYACAGRRLA